jgi:anti-sigma factor RsiW
MDGQLAPGEAQVVAAHLNACAACAEELELLRQVDAALVTLPVLEEPPGLTARVMARVRSGDSAPSAKQVSPFRLRWDDALVSFAFAWAATTALTVALLVLSRPVAEIQLRQSWGALLVEFNNAWRILQAEPAYVLWELSLFGMASATAVTIGLLRKRFLGSLWI